MEKATVREYEAPSRRIFLKSPVLNPEPIIDLQNNLSGVTSLDIIPSEKLHLTLLHFGKPNELFRDIANINPELNARVFSENLSKVLTSSIKDKTETELSARVLSLFEKNLRPILVLELNKNPEFLELRERVLSSFEDFLTSCGINDINSFMAKNPNLSYQTRENFIPHISLGFLNDSLDIPEIDVNELIVRLGSPALGNEINGFSNYGFHPRDRA